MNPYFLETEMEWRPADLRRELERSRQAADLLAGLFRASRPDRGRHSARPDIAGCRQPRVA